MRNRLLVNIVFIISLTSLSFGEALSQNHLEIKLEKAIKLTKQNKQRTALDLLVSGLTDIKNEKNLKLKTNYFMQMGDLYLLLGKYRPSYKYLALANTEAKKGDDKKLLEASYNNLGNINLYLGRMDKATKYYKKALKYATDKSVALSIKINKLKAESFIDDDKLFIKKFIKLSKILNTKKDLKNSVNFLAFSANMLERRFFLEKDTIKLLKASSKIGDAILKLPSFTKNTTQTSIVLGAKAKLYLVEGKTKEALDFFNQAAFFAQTQNLKPDLLYYWKFRIAKIYKNSGETAKAIQYYEDSLKILEPIKQQLYYGFRDIRDRFNKEIVPVYKDLIELHIVTLEELKDEVAIQENLKEILSLYSRLKSSEISFFFLNECISSYKGGGIAIPDGTTIIYPISLENQLLVIYQNKDGYKYYQNDISSDELYQLVQNFRYQLQVRVNAKFIHYSHMIYDMIIAPFEKELKDSKITQLVFSPQGFMGMIPYSALMKTDKFLIEEFSITQINTLESTRFKIQEKEPHALILGLSDARHEMSALPNVVYEVKNVSSMFKKNTILINEGYTRKNVQKVLNREKITHLHVATHGVFDSDPDDSFLSAFDEPIMLPKLKTLLDTKGDDSKNGYDLITLSACQSSLGNEKALLGLAGVGLQAGASTVLATLWYVDDEATKEIIDTFYNSLKKKNSRGKSLQLAQKSLIQTKRYWHPAYWSPFIMIGDWR